VVDAPPGDVPIVLSALFPAEQGVKGFEVVRGMIEGLKEDGS